MIRSERMTKIIATLGPATDSPEKLEELIRSGVDVFRLNMSHAQHDWCIQVSKDIREKAAVVGRHVAILLDLQGPSIRTGDLEEPYELKIGDEVEFRNSEAPSTTRYSTTVNYPGMMEDVKEGDTLVVDNGTILMKIIKCSKSRIMCEVKTEGKMGSRRHINLPGVRLNLPALTDKDRADINVAAKINVDYVAGSFVRDAAHVNELREALEGKGLNAHIVSKIEDQEAIRNIRDIIEASDVIMVARGDLGIEVNVEELPIIQRRIVSLCHEIGRRVIVATHMLESMIQNPTPTRAEVTDVSNAVFEQADSVMLSGETSVGAHPIRCVESLDRISCRMERTTGLNLAAHAVIKSDKQKVVKASVQLADSIRDSKIVVFTRRGITAIRASLMRPEHAHIFAFTPDVRVCQKLALARGITPFLGEIYEDVPKTIDAAIAQLMEAKLIEPGTPLVIISDILQGEYIMDSVMLHRA